MYVNDIHKAVPDVNIRLFADDTNMFIHDKNYKTLMQTVNENLSKLNDWLTVNKLSLNLNKTCYSVYSSDKINDFKFTLNCAEIKRVKSCKYLGVIIDDELKFDIHIDYIYNTHIRYVGILYKLAHKLPYFYRRNIYYAFVNSHVANGIEIYANTSKTLLHKLHVLNNKLLRILQQQAPLTPIYQLNNTYNTLPIHLLCNQKNIGTGTLFNISCL